jgi:hypothetical protein
MATKKKARSGPAARSLKNKKRASSQPYVIARCTRAGVHAGYLVSENARWVTLRDARRLWYWNGAGSLSEIAVYGCNVKSHEACKFGARVARQRLQTDDVCELIDCQHAGHKMIEAQPEWRA